MATIEGKVTKRSVTKALTISQQQLMFIDGIMAGKSQTQAYIDAGYSPNGARGAASKLQSVANVAAELAKRKAEYAKAAGIDKIWVLEQYKQHITAELPDLFDDDGMLLPPKKWPKHMRRVVDKVKVVQNKTGAIIKDSNGQIIKDTNGLPIVVPMYTKEVSLESKLPALAKLLDWIAPVAPKEETAVHNTQVNIAELLVLLDTPIVRKVEAE